MPFRPKRMGREEGGHLTCPIPLVILLRVSKRVRVRVTAATAVSVFSNLRGPSTRPRQVNKSTSRPRDSVVRSIMTCRDVTNFSVNFLILQYFLLFHRTEPELRASY